MRLNPVQGAEIGKTRRTVIISPDEANDGLRTVLVAPLTSVRRAWPSRIPVNVSGVEGDLALDQIRAIDKTRLNKRIARLSTEEAEALSSRLVEMFTL